MFPPNLVEACFKQVRNPLLLNNIYYICMCLHGMRILYHCAWIPPFCLTVQDRVQEVCAHEERDVDAEPHQLSKRDGLEAGAEPQLGTAHHTGGCGTGWQVLAECRTVHPTLAVESQMQQSLWRLLPHVCSPLRRRWRRRSRCQAPRQASTLWAWWFSPCASVWSSGTWRSRAGPSGSSSTAWTKPSWGWWPSSSGQWLASLIGPSLIFDEKSICKF